MSSRESRQGTSKGQADSHEESVSGDSSQRDLLETLLGRELAAQLIQGMQQPRQPRIVPWGVYALIDIADNLEVSKNTVEDWTKKRNTDKTTGRVPLKPIQPGTKRIYFLGATVLEYMQKNG